MNKTLLLRFLNSQQLWFTNVSSKNIWSKLQWPFNWNIPFIKTPQNSYRPFLNKHLYTSVKAVVSLNLKQLHPVVSLYFSFWPSVKRSLRFPDESVCEVNRTKARSHAFPCVCACFHSFLFSFLSNLSFSKWHVMRFSPSLHRSMAWKHSLLCYPDFFFFFLLLEFNAPIKLTPLVNFPLLKNLLTSYQADTRESFHQLNNHLLSPFLFSNFLSILTWIRRSGWYTSLCVEIYSND